MLDVVYIAATIVLFALVALIAKGVEKLGPWPRGSAQHEVKGGGDQG